MWWYTWLNYSSSLQATAPLSHLGIVSTGEWNVIVTDHLPVVSDIECFKLQEGIYILHMIRPGDGWIKSKAVLIVLLKT